MTTTALQNINPLTVEIPAAFALAFETTIDDIERLNGSTKALRDAAEKAGFTLAHLSNPNKESTPEHRFNYAMSKRMAAQRLAYKLGAPLEAFEPVFNDATESKASLTIGGETKTKKAWQQSLSFVWKNVKEAWTKSIRAEADDLQAIARAAKAELDALKTAAEKTAMVVDAQEAQEQEVQKQLALANAEAESAATAKDKAKAKAKLAMVEEKLEAQRALVAEAEAADQAALLACAIQAEALDEIRLDVLEKLALLPAARGPKERANKVDAFAKALDALIKTATEADDLGDADIDDVVHHLKFARKLLNQPAH
jgi:hypothetical protein